ncbi:MAG TPA: alpha/beta hydrolase, partial [Reyranella sp.]
MTAQPVPGVTLKTAKANNIHMRYAEIGSGPLVLFCHGWPESWYSWRHQLTAVSAAGFRCVAPDMRGYGGTEAPEPIDQYTLHHLVGDMAELVKGLGEGKATIVGHDWGAPVAWHAALWRPDLFPAVCAMSVPYAPPGYVDILSALEKLGINDFYLQYFQKPGVPEAELQQDIRSALRRLYFTAGGEL